MQRLIVRAVAHLATYVVFAHATFGSPRPNLVLVMADDLGYETVGCYGGTSYQTPHLDQLAATGIRFNHAYATPLCTNTRVQLMTGMYNNRNWRAFGILDPNEKTFGHYLQQAGYTTCIVGKWQLQSYDPPDYPGAATRRGTGMHPKDAGFHEYCLWHTGHTEAKGSRYADPVIEQNGQILEGTNGRYGPDIWTEYLSDFITRHRNEPFFVYYPMALPHNPMVPTPHSPAWADHQTRHRDQTHFAKDMIQYVDTIVGRIVTKLDELGLRENTLLLFFSDNGTNGRVVSRMGDRIVRGGKGLGTDLGTRVPLIANWPAFTPAGVVSDDLVDSTDFLPTLLAAAQAELSPHVEFDGRSFFPQLQGNSGQPRDWIYMHQDPRPGWDKDRFYLIRFARNQRFKLYEDGRLFNVTTDLLEEHPFMPDSDAADMANARDSLQHVLDSMKPYPIFRPDEVPRLDPNAAQREHHAFQDQGGYVVIEAETPAIPRNESWRRESYIPGYLGTGYLRALRDQPGHVQHQAVPFRANLAAAGQWQLSIRHRTDRHRGSQQPAFWVRIDSGPWMICQAAGSRLGQWHWTEQARRTDDASQQTIPMQFQLAENQHTIYLAPYAANIKVDRLVLYQSDRKSRALHEATPQSDFHPW